MGFFDSFVSGVGSVVGGLAQGLGNQLYRDPFGTIGGVISLVDYFKGDHKPATPSYPQQQQQQTYGIDPLYALGGSFGGGNNYVPVAGTENAYTLPPLLPPTTGSVPTETPWYDVPLLDVMFPPSGGATMPGSTAGAPAGTAGSNGGGAACNAMTLARSPFRPTMAGARAQPFMMCNPVTGALTWFKPAGRPILFSGDLSACKRVEKVARRARRARPR